LNFLQIRKGISGMKYLNKNDNVWIG